MSVSADSALSFDDVLTLALQDKPDELFSLANALRLKHHGKVFETCAIMNARSGKCSEDCKWCSQSAHYSTDIAEYGLVDSTQMLAYAKVFDDNNIDRFSLVTSGRALSNSDIENLAQAYKFLKDNLKISLCGSLGLLNEEQLQKLYNAGMRRYHCNLETAPSHFPKLCSTHTIEEKVRTINFAKKIGLEICSGGIIGMGESLEQRIEFAFKLKEIGAVSIPVNILNPIKGTPLYGIAPLKDDDVLKAFAIFRIVNPASHIRFAGGRLQIRHIQEKALYCGVSAALVGDLLTTIGNDLKSDLEMINRLGYEHK